MRKSVVALGLLMTLLFARTVVAGEQSKTGTRSQERNTYQIGSQPQTRTQGQQTREQDQSRTREQRKNGSRPSPTGK